MSGAKTATRGDAAAMAMATRDTMTRFPAPVAESAQRHARDARAGMTLVEVILATVILGTCLFGLMTGLTANLEVFRASAFVHEAENAFHAGEALHPMTINADPVDDLEVAPDSDALEGWTYERTVEEDDDEDGLYVVRVKVVKGRGGSGSEMEFVRLIYHNQ